MAMLLPGDLKGSHPKSPAGHRTAQSPERGPRVTSVVLGSENDVSHSIGTQGSPESQTSVLRSGRFSWPYRPSLSSTFSVEPWDFDVVLVAQSCPNTWSGLPFPSPGDLPDPEIKSGFPALQVDSSPNEPPGCFDLKPALR